MNCPECQDQLQTLLDGEPIDRAALAGHLAGCATCRETFAAADQLRGVLHRLTPVAVPVGFSGSVRGEWLGRRARVRRLAYASMAVAAAVLIGVSVWGVRSIWSRPHRHEIVKPEPEKTQPQPPPAVKPVKTASHVGEGLFSFGNQFTSSLSKQAKPLINRLPDAKLPIPNAVLPLGGLGRAVTNGLEPVFDSASGIVEVILKSLPLDDGAAKDK